MIIGTIKYFSGMFITTLVLYCGFYWKEITNEPDFGGNDDE